MCGGGRVPLLFILLGTGVSALGAERGDAGACGRDPQSARRQLQHRARPVCDVPRITLAQTKLINDVPGGVTYTS